MGNDVLSPLGRILEDRTGVFKNADGVFAAVFGVKHRQVGIVHQLFGIGGRVGRYANTATGTQRLRRCAVVEFVDLFLNAPS